ncbi:MAG: NAD(P)H-binding protein [Acidimicrobiales bacterium]|nr:NAD(P)H-binding protein [Acidimicrobiales bacterium]
MTGSTGRLGGMVAQRLAAAGVTQRLLVRDLGRAPALPVASAVRASYEDRDAIVAALDGVDVVFMASTHEGPDRLDQHFTFVDAAAEAGVEHIVYTSFFGASSDSTFTLAREPDT